MLVLMNFRSSFPSVKFLYSRCFAVNIALRIWRKASFSVNFRVLTVLPWVSAKYSGTDLS
jgi:hypothetical protein